MQGDLLEKLQGAGHVMQLRARGQCSYVGSQWHAVLFQPAVKHLTQSDPLLLVCQVGNSGDGVLLPPMPVRCCTCLPFIGHCKCTQLPQVQQGLHMPANPSQRCRWCVTWPRASASVHSVA